MSKRQRLAIIWRLVLSPFVLMILCSTATASEKVVFAQFELEFPPHQYRQQEGYVGSNIELIKMVFGRMPDYQLEIKLLPLKRAAIDFESGAVDAILNYRFKRFERSTLYTTIPLYRNVFRPVSLADSGLQLATLDSLHGLTLATINFTPLNKALVKAEENNQFELLRISKYQRLYQMLKRRRVDAVLSSYSRIQALAKKDGLPVTVHDYPLSPSQGMYFCISKKARVRDIKKLRRQFDQALLSIHRDGSFDRLMKQHGIEIDAEHSPLGSQEDGVTLSSSDDSNILKQRQGH